MDIAKENAKEIKSYLKQEKAVGYEYVVFEAAANVISKEQLYPTKLYRRRRNTTKRNRPMKDSIPSAV